MQTHVPPWLYLSSNGMVKNYSSCLLVIRQPSCWSRKEPHWWKLYLKWLRDVILQLWLFMVSWDIVGSLPMINVCWHKDGCHEVVASSHPCPYCQCARWCLRRWWKQVLDWLCEMSCTLLLIVILSWVLGKLNARMFSTLLMACRIVHPLPLIECFCCRSCFMELVSFFVSSLKWWFGLGFASSHQIMNRRSLYYFFLQNVSGHIRKGLQ
jgi:hypothetical protein